MTSILSPICIKCKHLRLEIGWKCDAFPSGIPDAIIYGEHDHTTPYKGDNGIMFERIDKK